jgi:hypothetical protein
MAIHPDQVRLGNIAIRALWDCPTSVLVGDPVYQVGSNSVDKADCRDEDKMPCEGVVDSKPSSTTCYVVSQGVVQISGWGLSPDENYFVGPGNGMVIASGLPSTPGTNIQFIGRSKNSEELLVDTRNPTEIL